MLVSGQIQALAPQGISKKKQRYAPMVQEQAKANTATQQVVDTKEQQRYADEVAMQEDQFRFQQDQAALASQQWQREMELSQQQFAQQKAYWARSNAQQKKTSDWEYAMGGLSMAANLYSLFS